MRKIGLLVLTLALAHLAPAQTGTPYHSLGGFGNVIYPGTGHAPNATAPTSFAHRLGNNIAGSPYGLPRVNHSHGNGAVIVPYPVVGGGYGFGGYGYYDVAPQQQQQQGPAQVYVSNPAPSVVINQTFVQDRAPVEQAEPESRSGLRVYEGLKTPPQTFAKRPADQPTLYLIAFKDRRIVPAFGYWLEGETLHYVTTDHTLNQASLDLIDRPMSQQLNDERSVEFKLPAER